MRHFIFLLLCCLSLAACSAQVASKDERKFSRSVSFKSGKYLLRGQLIAYEIPERKVPAIIFIVGSGESSYSTNYYDFLKYFFETNFSPDSVALFYFDKRGYGGSEGKWQLTSIEERADDVKAAADYLKTLPFIDGDRIAVAGHSQGGWVAQVVLAKYPNAFKTGISMAGPSFGVRRQVVNDYASKYICAGLNPQEAIEMAEKKTAAYIRLASTFPLRAKWKQLQVINKFDPAAYIRKIQAPFSFLFASNDALVHPDWSRQTLKQLFNSQIPSHFDIRTFDNVNHDFMDASLCTDVSMVRGPYSKQVKLHLKNWIDLHLLK